MRAAPDPGFSPGGLGPHLTSSVSLAGFPPVFPFARRALPLRPPSSGFPSSGVLRFVPFGRCPVPVRCPSGFLPWSNLHGSAAAGRFRRRWSRAARAKVTSPAAIPRLDLAVIRPALQMGSGWARWDAATESPVTSGRTRRTPPRPNRPDNGSGRVGLPSAAAGGFGRGAGGPGRCGMVIPAGWLARQEGPGPQLPGRPGEGCRGTRSEERRVGTECV